MTESNAVTLYTAPIFQNHITGRHPESPQRIHSLQVMLEQTNLIDRFKIREPTAISRKFLEPIHPTDYIDSIADFAQQGGGRIESDTVVSPASFEVALHAAGAATSAVDDVLKGDVPQSVCLVRPPGHHCRPAQAMGFCLFGNVAVAAQYALDVYGLDRILVIDWDVHHGNGTQEIFYESERVHFFSAHRFPFYPGTGDFQETGTGSGLGATWNLPVEFGTARLKYLEQFESLLSQAAKKCRPQLILLSAGFDAHKDDPIGSLGLETEDFGALTEIVCQTAREYCDGKLISVLEGGYNLQALADSVELHLRTILKSA